MSFYWFQPGGLPAISVALGVACSCLHAQSNDVARADAGFWSGAYVGGAGLARSSGFTYEPTSVQIVQVTGVTVGSATLVVPPTEVQLPRDGMPRAFSPGAGAYAGFNASFVGTWVAGLEAGIATESLERSTTNEQILGGTSIATFGHVIVSRDVRSPWIGSLRARFGRPVGDALLYLAGGPAVARATATSTDEYGITPRDSVAHANPGANFGPFRGVGADTETLIGWTAGAGICWALTTRVRFGFEYQHSLFAGKIFSTGAVGSASVSDTPRIALRDDRLVVRADWAVRNLLPHGGQ